MVRGLKDLIAWIDIEDATLVEIGSWVGESTSIFARSCKEVISIDPHIGPHDGFNVAKKYFNYLCSKVDNISNIPLYSCDAWRKFEWHSVDVVYIDGNHDYDAVMEDIYQWLPIIKDGGVICGHDYDDIPHHGVQRAVDEMFGKPDKTFIDYSWAIRVNTQKLPHAIAVM